MERSNQQCGAVTALRSAADVACCCNGSATVHATPRRRSSPSQSGLRRYSKTEKVWLARRTGTASGDVVIPVISGSHPAGRIAPRSCSDGVPRSLWRNAEAGGSRRPSGAHASIVMCGIPLVCG